MHPVTYRTRRLLLRELTPDDVDDVFAIHGDARATEHLASGQRTHEQVATLLEHAVATAIATPRQEYNLAVVRASGADLIGYARLALDPHQPAAATIGFALNPAVWGQGLGTETVHAILGFGITDLGLHRIWAARAPTNMASHHVLVRAGFTQEGIIRGHVKVRGAWRDSITYGILGHEWAPADNVGTQ